MIDFRSDVLGPFAEGALDALNAAAGDPSGFVWHEDPHQERLERTIAEMFGFEGALYVPTGTMANQIAVRIWCGPGERLIADLDSHIHVNEASCVAGLNGVAVQAVEGKVGHLRPEAVKRALAATVGSTTDRRAKLVWLENTHNRAGGTVMPFEWLPQIVEICRSVETPIHMDGARIWHAAISSGRAFDEIAHGVSSMTVSLNKALGAPIGAVVMGDTDFIAEAARVVKMFGGLWRPVGALAAAAHAAIRNPQMRIALTHERARQLAGALQVRLAGTAEIPAPETNIVMLGLSSDTAVDAVRAGLAAQGVRASPYGRQRLRFVLHSGISVDDVQRASSLIATEVERTLKLSKERAAS